MTNGGGKGHDDSKSQSTKEQEKPKDTTQSSKYPGVSSVRK